jgi:hypothetical protein
MKCDYHLPIERACCYGDFIANVSATSNQTSTTLAGPISLAAVCVASAVGMGIMALILTRRNVREEANPLNFREKCKKSYVFEAKVQCGISLIFTISALATAIWVSYYPNCPSWVQPNWDTCYCIK